MAAVCIINQETDMSSLTYNSSYPKHLEKLPLSLYVLNDNIYEDVFLFITC